MFRSIQTKTMFFMASLAICLIVIIGYMTVFAMDYAIDEIKENDMRDKAIMAANVVSRDLGRNSQPTAEILAALDKDSLNGDIFLINSRGYLTTLAFPANAASRRYTRTTNTMYPPWLLSKVRTGMYAPKKPNRDTCRP